MFDIKKILVPTDFSRISYSAFEYARDLAERMDSEIHIIHVMEKSPPLLSANKSGLTEEEVVRALEVEARKKLSEAASCLKEDSGILVKEVFRIGNDYEEIVNYAKEINSDIIIIATHGRTGILHTLMGSVAEKVIRFSKCPVLVISAKEEE
jgi:nucleotide-binding universal stress UspA family protein